ncbi:coiled-coil domain containing 7 [Chelydra serpentina]|uniref:Coiled-coil domain containing 7 n=1 Tax=Chelydra serpentina TaxID=8475 RepID=A0A8T1TDA1_CHESE|nr:coiled-coil domain containing 7 [Chelydra serpentina]
MKINGKDLSKKSKPATKSKGKGEDNPFSRRKSINGTDKSIQKLPAVDTGKQTGELLSRKTPVETEKNQETVISQLKDVKLEKKVLTNKENSKDYGIPGSSLKEKVLVQEREQLYKAKESAGVMEETPKLQFPQPEYERVQQTHSTDKGPLPMLPVKIKEESKGEKKHTEEKSETVRKFLFFPFMLFLKNVD